MTIHHEITCVRFESHQATFLDETGKSYTFDYDPGLMGFVAGQKYIISVDYSFIGGMSRLTFGKLK